MEKVAGRVICTFSGRKKTWMKSAMFEIGQLVDVGEFLWQALNRVFLLDALSSFKQIQSRYKSTCRVCRMMWLFTLLWV